MKNVSIRGRKRHIEAVAEEVNPADAARRRIGGYLGGMKQRVGIPQAVLGNPVLLLVAKPQADVDPEDVHPLSQSSRPAAR